MPIIEQSPLVMECEVIDTYEIDSFKNYICTILNTYIEEDMLDEKDKPDYAKLKPVLFEMPTYKYLRTGDIIGDCVKMGKAAFQREESDACISSSELVAGSTEGQGVWRYFKIKYSLLLLSGKS